MGFVPFNNVIKLEPIFNWAGQIVENVMYYLVDETPALDTAEDMIDSYVATWQARWRAHAPSNLGLVSVKATIMENQNDPGIEKAVTTNNVGTGLDPSTPNHVTVAIKLVTPYRGRSYRGRIYHIGMVTTQISQNTITGATKTLLEDFYSDLIALETNVGPAVLCVASRISNHQERAVGLATAVTGVVVNTTVDSQRRRLPERGR